MKDIPQAIYATYKADKPRKYLGGSIAGHGETCERQLWYRWKRNEDFPGKTRRLFEHGHIEEERVIRDLNRAGYQVVGNQLEATAFDGVFQIHIDGLIMVDGKLSILEIKTSNVKNFVDLTEAWDMLEWDEPKLIGRHRKALAKWEVHHAQMQLGMGLFGMDSACYLVVCKDNDKIYTREIPFDQERFDSLMAMIERVIKTDSLGSVSRPELPARAVVTPEQFGVCQWCPGHDECWSGKLDFGF
jgi:hypothetical protein